MDDVQSGLNCLSIDALIWLGTKTPAFNKLSKKRQLDLIAEANRRYPPVER